MWTGVCAKQMKNLEKHRGDFESRGAVALGMSVDTTPSKKAWAEDLGVERPDVGRLFTPMARWLMRMASCGKRALVSVPCL